MAFDAYKNEKAVLDHADALLGAPEGVDFENEYRVLHRSYAKLYKGSRTTLAQWAAANGYQCAQLRIPDSWLHEAPNPRAIAAITAFLKDPKK